MILPRAPARWTGYLCKFPLRTARNTVYRRTGRRVQRRTYASEGGEGGAHSAHKSGSDLPWAVTSAVVTIPCFWYLLQPQLHKTEHSGGHEHGEHDQHAEESHEGEDGKGEDGNGDGDSGVGDEGKGSTEEKSQNRGEDDLENGGQGGEGDSEGGDSGDVNNEGGQDTHDTSEDEGASNYPHEKEGGGHVEGVRFKGAAQATKEGERFDTRKHIPDAKGGNKKRIESHYGQQQGVAQDASQDPSKEDLAASAKPAGDMTTQSGKQQGISNTDTKHSTDIVNDPQKSMKGEGTPETAKSKGTVDPGRPQQ